jgi:alkylglycerol monooxygenase
MDAKAIALSIPIFFLLIGVEILFARRREGEKLFALHDSINSLSCGVGQQMMNLVTVAAKVGGYTFVYNRFRIADVPMSSVAGWVAILFGVDFCYFLYHWASHRVNFFWATHAVHHQSEEYNLTTALRQSWFTGLTSWLFYLPLAVAGFPPAMFVLMVTFNTLYQFWIHTRLVGKLGFLEAFLNTPSHHRVHHGIDPRYIDKNYAGLLIVWDRMFGTFAPEEGEPVYGTVKPLSSWNPVWANLEPWAHLVKMSRQTRRLRDKFWIFFAPPEWRPADLGGKVTIPEVSREAQRKYRVSVPRSLNGYVVLGFTTIAASTTALLSYEPSMSRPMLYAAVGLVYATLVGWGALEEAKPWAVPFEWARLALVTGFAGWVSWRTAAFAPVTGVVFAAALGLAVWAGRYRGRAPARGSILAPEAASPG